MIDILSHLFFIQKFKTHSNFIIKNAILYFDLSSKYEYSMLESIRANGAISQFIQFYLSNGSYDYLYYLLKQSVLKLDDFLWVQSNLARVFFCFVVIIDENQEYYNLVLEDLITKPLMSIKVLRLCVQSSSSVALIAFLRQNLYNHILDQVNWKTIYYVASLSHWAEYKCRLDEHIKFGHFDYFSVADGMTGLTLTSQQIIESIPINTLDLSNQWIVQYITSKHHLLPSYSLTQLLNSTTKVQRFYSFSEQIESELHTIPESFVYYQDYSCEEVTQLRLPSVHIQKNISHCLYQDATLLASGIVINGDKILSSSLNCDLSSAYHLYPSVSIYDRDRRLVSLSFESSSEKLNGVYLNAIYSRDPFSYVHFLFDILPRIVFADASQIHYDHIVMNGPLRSWQIDLLLFFDVDLSKVRCLSSGSSINVDKLLQIEASDGYYPRPEALLSLRNHVCIKLSSFDWEGNSTGKIFAGRRAQFRTVRNEINLIKTAAFYGYKYCLTSGMTVTQQIKLFANISAFLCVGGASMANLIFAKPNSTVIHLGPASNWGNYFLYACGLFDLDYCGIAGPSEPTLNERYVASDYVIHEDLLDAILSNY